MAGWYDDGPFFLPTRFDTYNETDATETMFGTPRFGHTKDVSAFIAGVDNTPEAIETSKSYGQGLMFIFLVILLPMVLWTICLLIWKFCCSSKVGFLSGDPFTSPYDASRAKFKAWQRHCFRTRILFVISCGLVITFSTLLVTRGLTNMMAVKNTLKDTNNDISGIITEARHTTNVLHDLGNVGIEIRSQLNHEINVLPICPGDTAFSRDPQGSALIAHTTNLMDLLIEVETMKPSRMDNFQEGLDDAKMHTDEFKDVVDFIDASNWIWGLVSVPLIVIPSILILGTFAAHFRFMNPSFVCFINWLFLPIFVIWIMAGYIFASIMGALATANADFCTGGGVDIMRLSPDTSMMQTLYYYGYTEDDFVLRATRYYVNQCTTSATVDPFIFMREYNSQMQQGKQITDQLLTTMDGISLGELSLVCNRDFSTLYALVQKTQELFQVLNDVTTRTVSLLSCERIVPVYTSTVYDGLCEYNIVGFYWTWVCLITLSIFGMLMITCRSSYQNAIIQKHETPKAHEALADDSQNDKGKLKKKNKNKNRDPSESEEKEWIDDDVADNDKKKIKDSPNKKGDKPTSNALVKKKSDSDSDSDDSDSSSSGSEAS